MIGIYKITSPNKRVYIGQSVNIKDRFNKYKKLNCKSQPKLYHSLLKYGADNHTFTIITECGVSELNNIERYYQELFNCIDKGLNCILQQTDTKRKRMSKETKIKISNSTKGRCFSDSTRLKISNALKGLKKTPTHIEKIAKSQRGCKRRCRTKEELLKLSENNKNSNIVLDYSNGVFYNSVTELSNLLGVKYSTLNAKLSGQNINTTKYARV